MNRVEIRQINLGKRIAAWEALCQDLEEAKNPVVALIQEPYMRKKRFPYIRGYKAIYHEDDQEKPRAVILIPLGLEYFPIPSLTDRDKIGRAHV